VLLIAAVVASLWVGVFATLYWQQMRRRRALRRRIERDSARGWVEEQLDRINGGSWARN